MFRRYMITLAEIAAHNDIFLYSFTVSLIFTNETDTISD